MNKEELYLRWSRGDHLSDYQLGELHSHVVDLNRVIGGSPHIVGQGSIFYVSHLLHSIESAMRARGLL